MDDELSSRDRPLELAWAAVFLGGLGLPLYEKVQGQGITTLDVVVVGAVLLTARLFQPRLVLRWLLHREHIRVLKNPAAPMQGTSRDGSLGPAKLALWGSLAVGLVVLQIEVLGANSAAEGRFRDSQAHINARLDQLAAAVKNGQPTPTISGPSAPALALDPELRAATLKFLQLGDPQEPKAPGIPLSWIGFAVGAALLAVIIFALHRRADGAAAAGIFALATSALAYANNVARLDPDTYWRVVCVLAILAALIALICWGAILRRPAQAQPALPDPQGQAIDEEDHRPRGFWNKIAGSLKRLLPSPKGDNKASEAPLVIALLPFVLLFVFCLVAYGAKRPEPGGATTKPPIAPIPKPTKVLAQPVGKPFQFPPGVPSPPDSAGKPSPDFDSELNELRAQLGELHAHPGDQILLVGMADCTPIRGGNDALARRRIDAIGNLLNSYATQNQLSIARLAVPQSDRCGRSAAQRAVIPFYAGTAPSTADGHSN